MAAVATCLPTSPGPTHWKPIRRPSGPATSIRETSSLPPMKFGLSGPALTTAWQSARPSLAAAASDRPVMPAE